MGRTLQQVANGIMFALFVTAAVVQYNDPDPVLWMIVYGAGALCCALYFAGALPVLLSGLVAGVCFVSALYLLAQILFGPIGFFDVTGQEMMGLVEETREMFGFLITALWTWILTWWSRDSTAPTVFSENV